MIFETPRTRHSRMGGLCACESLNSRGLRHHSMPSSVRCLDAFDGVSTEAAFRSGIFCVRSRALLFGHLADLFLFGVPEPWRSSAFISRTRPAASLTKLSCVGINRNDDWKSPVFHSLFCVRALNCFRTPMMLTCACQWGQRGAA